MVKRLEGIEGELTGLRNENQPRDEILRRIIDEINDLWKKTASGGGGAGGGGRSSKEQMRQEELKRMMR